MPVSGIRPDPAEGRREARLSIRDAEADRLDRMAAQVTGLAAAQLLAAEADRLRRIGDMPLRRRFAIPLLRN